MNRVSLVGRITNKPELRYTNGNLAYTRFTVAVNRTFQNRDGEREADFITVVAWRKQAENVCNFLDKGALISVDGRIQTGTFDDKDGNRRYTTEVVADNVGFLESRSRRESAPAQVPSAPTGPSPYDYQPSTVSVDNDPFADFGDSVAIDDNFLE